MNQDSEIVCLLDNENLLLKFVFMYGIDLIASFSYLITMILKNDWSNFRLIYFLTGQHGYYSSKRISLIYIVFEIIIWDNIYLLILTVKNSNRCICFK